MQNESTELRDARYRVYTVARRLGVHPSTLKRLELRGLFTPTRDRAGHRRYSQADLASLRAILFPPPEGERPGG